MAKTPIKVILTAPERASAELNVSEIMLPGEDGIFTVLPGHTHFLTTLGPGVAVAYTGGETPKYYALSGGFAEVRDDTVRILADAFEEGKTIDLPRAEAALERAEVRLKKPPTDLDVKRAEMALQRSLARISAQKHEGY